MSELERKTGDIIPAGYAELLQTLKSRIRTAQTRVALAANRELIQLYWDIGQEIVNRQQRERWGASVIARLAADLQHEFPGVAGFSPRNIWRMRAFYLAYASDPILSQVATEIENSTPPPSVDAILSQVVTELENTTPPAEVAALPWFHNVILVESIKDGPQRLWYAQMAQEHGWSRNILVLQIKSELYARQGKAITNFQAALPPPQSDLAQQVLKDPYIFDFLTLTSAAHEREVEEQLTGHVVQFLLELGAGFAFLGRQVHLEIAEQDYYLDLLFYHTRLHCYVVIELKAREFSPEDAGKLNFYLSAVDDRLRSDADQPTIGILLCRGKRKFVVEYALRGLTKPIGVADWQDKLVAELPENLRPVLPTVAELEAELLALYGDAPADDGGNGDE